MNETQSIASNAALKHSNPAPIGLSPNKADIAAHLYALFPPAFVHPHQHSWIEIAWSDPADGQLNRARKFSAFDLNPVIDFAERKNAAGCNVYVGAALRRGEMPEKGRSNDDNFQAAAFAWAEFDGAGDEERIAAILKEKQLTPALVVTTGLVPNLRAHLYFAIDDGADRERLVAALKALKTSLKSDNVDNASRVMRLAGTVNHPTAKKLQRGYEAELVTLRKHDAPTYRTDVLINLAPVTSPADPFTKHAESTAGGRSDDVVLTLLEKSRVDGKWHESMRSVTATMAGRGRSAIEMKLMCGSYCKGGAEDADLKVLIDGAIAKYQSVDCVDADIPPVKEGDERIANQAPVAAELPTIRINPRISMVTTRTQKTLIEAGVPFYQRGGGIGSAGHQSG